MKPLNINDPEVHRLATVVAREPGATKASVEELRAIAMRAAAHVYRPYQDHADFLYDENGLPK